MPKEQRKKRKNGMSIGDQAKKLNINRDAVGSLKIKKKWKRQKLFLLKSMKHSNF